MVLRAAAAATVEPAARGDDVIHDSGRVLRVGTSPDPSHRGTAVAIVRFNLGAAAAASVRRGSDLVSAVLQVHIRGSGTNANNILQVSTRAAGRSLSTPPDPAPEPQQTAHPKTWVDTAAEHS